MEQIKKTIPDAEDPCFLPKYTLILSDEERNSLRDVARQKARKLREQQLLPQKILVEVDGECIGHVVLHWIGWVPHPYYCGYVNYPLFNFTDYSKYDLDVNWYSILNHVYQLAENLFGVENILPFPGLSYGNKSIIGWDHDSVNDRINFTPLELAINEVKFVYYLIKLYENEIVEIINSNSDHDNFFDTMNV